MTMKLKAQIKLEKTGIKNFCGWLSQDIFCTTWLYLLCVVLSSTACALCFSLGAQPSKPESPKPSSDVIFSETPVTVSPLAEVSIAEESISVPSPATPLHSSASAISQSSGSGVGNLNSVLTPLVANPVHTTLRPTTKRKIIEALKEEYTERLELAVKGRHEVEEDISKHKSKTKELTESIVKRKAQVEKLEKELQEMQKEMWHKNQAIQALESSLEQFTKEEAELKKNLLILQEADPEPPAKKNRSEESSCCE